MSGSWSSRSLPETVRRTFAALLSAADHGRLAHGYIVAGPHREWGVLFAVLLAQWILCREKDRPCGECRSCRAVESRTHADMSWLEPESKSRVIKIDEIREANHFLHQTSFEGGWKVAAFVDAHRLNTDASNAFLKTLEEPPPNCLILLITDSPQSLLPTIVSRCQTLSLAADGEAAERSKVEMAMLEWLRKRQGRPAPIEQAAWIGAIMGEVRDAAEKLEKERASEELEKEVLEARVQSRALAARIEILRTLYQWERDVLAVSAGAGTLQLFYPGDLSALQQQGRQTSLAAKLHRLEQVEHARRLLEGNAQEQAVWEAVLPA